MQIPMAAGHRPAHLAMDTHAGGDQCAVALARGGLGGFEPPMPEVFLAECRAAHGYAVDVGANTGLYALLAALGNCALRVAAFEPLPHVHTMLQRNVQLNQLDSKISTYPHALGSQSGTATLYIPTAHTGLVETSASLAPDFKDSIASTICVPIHTLDSWWEEAGRPHVGVLKVDVESREADVLLGARQILSQDRPAVFYELLPQGDAGTIDELARTERLTDIRLAPGEARISPAAHFDPEAWNHLLAPTERLDAVIARLRRVGLTVIDNR